MLHGVEFEEQRVHALVRFSGGDVAVPSRLAAAHGRPPRSPPGEEVLLQGGYDLLRDLLADFGLAGHRVVLRYPAYIQRDRSRQAEAASFLSREDGEESPLARGIAGRLPAFKVSFETRSSLKVSSLVTNAPQDTEGFGTASPSLDVQARAIGSSP